GIRDFHVTEFRRVLFRSSISHATENRCRSRQPTPVQVQPELRAKRFGTVVKSSVGCEISRQGLIKIVGAPFFPGLIRLLSLISRSEERRVGKDFCIKIAE